MKYFIWFGIIAALFVANSCAIATKTKSEVPKGDALKPKREALVSSGSGNIATNYLSPSLKYLPPTPLSVNNNQGSNHGSHGSSPTGYGLGGASGGGFDFTQAGAPKIKTYIIQTQPGHGSAHNGAPNAFTGGFQFGAGHSGGGAVYNSGGGYSGGAGHNGAQSYSNGAIYLSGGGGHNSGAAGHNGGGGAVYSSVTGYSAGVGHNGGAAASGGAIYNSGSAQSSNRAGYGGIGGYSGGGAAHSGGVSHISSSGGTLYSSGAGHRSSGGAVHSNTDGGYSSSSGYSSSGSGGGGYSTGAAQGSSGNSAGYSGGSGDGYKRGGAGGGGKHFTSGASHYYGGSGYSGYKSNHKSTPYIKTFVIPVSDIYKGEGNGGHGGHLHLGPKIHVVGSYGGGGAGGGGLGSHGGHGGYQHTSSAVGFGNTNVHVPNGGNQGGHGGSNGAAATLDSYLGQGKDGTGTLESYLGGALVLGGLPHGGVQGGHGGNGGGGGGGATVSYANYAGFGGNDYSQSAHSNSLANYGITADVTVTSNHGADGAQHDSHQNSGEDTPSYAVGHKGLGHFSFSASKPQALGGDNLITLGKSGYAVYSGRAPFKPSTFLGNTHEASAETGSPYLPPTSAGYQFESPSVLQGGTSASGGTSYLPPQQH